MEMESTQQSFPNLLRDLQANGIEYGLLLRLQGMYDTVMSGQAQRCMQRKTKLDKRGVGSLPPDHPFAPFYKVREQVASMIDRALFWPFVKGTLRSWTFGRCCKYRFFDAADQRRMAAKFVECDKVYAAHT